MISEDDTARIQQELGQLALAAVGVDLDGFLEVVDLVGSPQALAAGLSPAAVTSAAGWADLARLLKPFRDNAVERVAQIRQELVDPDSVVAREAACPGCGERRVDELSINEDDSVLCATCGRRYQLPSREEAC